jgi:hypothetical protein
LHDYFVNVLNETSNGTDIAREESKIDKTQNSPVLAFCPSTRKQCDVLPVICRTDNEMVKTLEKNRQEMATIMTITFNYLK